MNTIKKIPQKIGCLFFCFLIPVAVMYLIYLARGIYPFGDGCVLVLDLNGQYVWFFEALRKCVHGDASFLYSFSRNLGGEFLGIYAYYLASPLSYLLCLFAEDRMLEGLLCLFLLKVGICGTTFGYYMKKTLKTVNPFAIVAFSTFYALSAYAIIHQNNTMWIDAVMWLPLLTLGMESLIKYGKYKLFTISLALTVFSNFYIGYMICIYCFLYFFLYYIAHAEGNRNNPLAEKAHFIKSLFRIFFYSVIALGSVVVILLGAYYSLNFGKTSFSDPSFSWNINFDIQDLLYKFLPGSYDTVRPEGLPFVYCGVLTLLLIPSYFLSKSYPMRQKIVSGVLVLLFLFSFTFNVVDIIWHGFQAPNWLNFRYSFILCFYLCVLACRALSELETGSLKIVAATGGLIAIFCIVLQKYDNGEFISPNDYSCIYFTLIALFVYLSILGCLKSTRFKKSVSAVLISVIALETFLNAIFIMNDFDEDVTYSKYSLYNNFLSGTRPIVEAVQSQDSSFYRMEKTYYRKNNDNMALGMRGLSGSTSTMNKETIAFLEKMGYASKSHWSKYLGGTPVNDSLLGIKYIVSDQKMNEKYYSVAAEDEKNGKIAYYNPYALSIAYGVDDSVLNFPLGYTNEALELTENDSPIKKFVSNVKATINGWLHIQETVDDSEYIDLYDSPFDRLNAMITSMLGEEETQNIFVPIPISSRQTSNLSRSTAAGGNDRYTKQDADKSAMLGFLFEVPEDVEIYFYLPSDYPREIELSLDGKKIGSFNGTDTSRIVSLGEQSGGEEYVLEMKLSENNLYVKNDSSCLYYIDQNAFQNAMKRLAKDQFLIDQYTESSFHGTITTSKEDELILTTIAYDEGWNILVDGKEVAVEKAFGSLIAFHIDGQAGSHEISMKYRPKVLTVGLWISISFILFFVMIVLLEPYFKKVKGVRMIVGVNERTLQPKVDDVPAQIQVIASPEQRSEQDFQTQNEALDQKAAPANQQESDSVKEIDETKSKEEENG